MGGQRHNPTEKTKKLVGDLMLHGATQESIAERLHICVETLQRHYRYEMFELKYDVNCEIENLALEQARRGEWKAIEMWLKCKAGWVPARPPLDKDEADNTKSLIEKLIDKIPPHG